MRAETRWVWFLWGVPAIAQPLIDYLRHLQGQGQTHVSIDDEARLILREFFIRAKTGKPSQPAAKQAVPASASAPAQAPAQPAPAAQPTNVDLTTPAAPAPKEKSDRITVAGGSQEEKLAQLKHQASQWAPAKALGTLRQTMVFSHGSPNADIMLVGEAPGFDEERMQEPFVGLAGQKLDGILGAMGLSRSSVYLTNIVKFRPSMVNQTTNNRKPSLEERAACMPIFQAEIDIVAPKVIIALGGTAAQSLLDSTEPVTKLRGAFHEFSGVPVRVTYHPSYILHNEATSEKRKLWEDMLSVMELLNMPINDKQRGYFLPKS
ncbi:uracil-DNA glycosylase [Verrucomicrobiaceae bacterium R5-34]|nr:uracil-DNA glycosylase [Verrucomicrobiaceae bacterium R5-34]